MSVNRILAFAVVGLSLGSSAMAAPIISGNGESWTSAVGAVCAQAGACFGVTVPVDAHPAWKDHTLTDPRAEWVSYADTGYGGSILAPRAGSASNPTGQTPIMEIVESFTGVAGGSLSVRFWADDTLAVYFNDDLMKAPVFGQDYCADAPIGCESGEYWDLNTTTTGGLDTLRLVAYQVGTGEDTTSNPFGVLYAGSYVGGAHRHPDHSARADDDVADGCRPGVPRCTSLASTPQRLIAAARLGSVKTWAVQSTGRPFVRTRDGRHRSVRNVTE